MWPLCLCVNYQIKVYIQQLYSYCYYTSHDSFVSPCIIYLLVRMETFFGIEYRNNGPITLRRKKKSRFQQGTILYLFVVIGPLFLPKRLCTYIIKCEKVTV